MFAKRCSRVSWAPTGLLNFATSFQVPAKGFQRPSTTAQGFPTASRNPPTFPKGLQGLTNSHPAFLVPFSWRVTSHLAVWGYILCRVFADTRRLQRLHTPQSFRQAYVAAARSVGVRSPALRHFPCPRVGERLDRVGPPGVSRLKSCRGRSVAAAPPCARRSHARERTRCVRSRWSPGSERGKKQQHASPKGGALHAARQQTISWVCLGGRCDGGEQRRFDRREFRCRGQG